LQQKDVTLEKCIEHARATELSRAQAAEMKQINKPDVSPIDEEIVYQNNQKSNRSFKYTEKKSKYTE
jgi:hypothetical protein